MTISRAFGSKGIGDELSHGEINDLADSPTYALDKRSGQTDTMSSVISCASPGRLVAKLTTTADADTTYSVSSGQLFNAPALSSNRTYTLSSTDAVAGDRLTFLNTSTSYNITIQTSAPATLAIIGARTSGGWDAPWAEFLYSGSAWILWRTGPQSSLAPITFTANGTTTVPRGCTKMLIQGCGGGGGGGASYQSSSATDRYNSGGAGGGGAMLLTSVVAVTVGATITVVVGAGGTGGAAAGDPGVNGSSTTVADGVTTYTLPGGGLGNGGYYVNTVGNAIWAVPGQSVPVNETNAYWSGTTAAPPGLVTYPGSGGYGVTNNSSGAGRVGSTSFQGYAAGGAGSGPGSDSGSYRGGGAGGSGGGGPYGAGGTAGAGGNGNNGGTGYGGGTGGSAAANSGAGGGGGGAPGCGSGGTGAQGVGGAGGSGQVTIIWLR